MKTKTKKIIIGTVSAALVITLATAGILHSVLIGKKIPKTNFSSDDGINFVKQFSVGINLGNSLQSFDQSNSGFGTADAMSETSWGCPKVTKEQIEMFCDNGMQIVRVGITWGTHCSGAPDYKIDPLWLARVKEVVDYIIDSGMYAIINIHGDDTIWYSVSDDKYNETSEIQGKLWRQIGTYFKDYDEHLLFENVNEPRALGSALEWKGGTAQERENVNKLNFDFVNVIRSLDGNNATRYLLIPTYSATGYKKFIDSMAVPNDERVIVSIHDYYEYEFCLHTENTKKTEWGSDKEKKRIDEYIEYIGETFVKNNIPVMFTEFGCVDKKNDSQRAEWIEYTMKKAAEYNIPCLWWDNGIPEYQYEYGGAFGAFDREKCVVAHPDIVEALNCLSK